MLLPLLLIYCATQAIIGSPIEKQLDTEHEESNRNLGLPHAASAEAVKIESETGKDLPSSVSNAKKDDGNKEEDEIRDQHLKAKASAVSYEHDKMGEEELFDFLSSPPMQQSFEEEDGNLDHFNRHASHVKADSVKLLRGIGELDHADNGAVSAHLVESDEASDWSSPEETAVRGDDAGVALLQELSGDLKDGVGLTFELARRVRDGGVTNLGGEEGGKTLAALAGLHGTAKTMLKILTEMKDGRYGFKQDMGHEERVRLIQSLETIVTYFFRAQFVLEYLNQVEEEDESSEETNLKQFLELQKSISQDFGRAAMLFNGFIRANILGDDPKRLSDQAAKVLGTLDKDLKTLMGMIKERNDDDDDDDDDKSESDETEEDSSASTGVDVKIVASPNVRLESEEDRAEEQEEDEEDYVDDDDDFYKDRLRAQITGW